MKRRKVLLRVNLEHGAIPIELAMAAAGFHRPDANEEFLCGYLPDANGVDRYHEARTPDVLAALADGTFDLHSVRPGDTWVEVTVVFRCTYQAAEPPCTTPSNPSSSR